MKEKKSRTPATAAAPAPGESGPGFLEDLRALLKPEQKWHYAFHGVVVLVALFYWVASLIRLPEASWAEIILYRPRGDNQLWPVITALSHFNLGDPTDAFNYGQGIGGFQVVILLPYVLAYAVFGGPGYMVMDAVIAWAYFLAAVLLLRRCNFGTLSSLIVATAVATGGLQGLSGKLNGAWIKLVGLCGEPTAEYHVPGLLGLPVFEKRIPRPMITEILLLLLLYFLFRLWHERRKPTYLWGMAIGSLLALLAQGDPFTLSAAGLLFLVVLGRTMVFQRWKPPWPFWGGLLLGGLCMGCYFLFQMFGQTEESAVRFGLAQYSRTSIHWLPTYGPLLRVGIICLLAGLVLWAIRRTKPDTSEPSSGESTVIESSSPASPLSGSNTSPNPIEASLAWFCVALIWSAWLAQPAQLFLLGKGAQTYHFLLFTLPIAFGYAAILLLFTLGRLAFADSFSSLGRAWGGRLSLARSMVLALGLTVITLLGIEEPIEGVLNAGPTRPDGGVWTEFPQNFRANLRLLDKKLREDPSLRDARSFVTFCPEVNYLLTAFHEKRAFLPDNGFTTLPDRELERRLCEVGKVLRLKPNAFMDFAQDRIVMNFWFGCAKYWCSSDYKFAPESDYTPQELEAARKVPKQAPFHLVLPISEKARIKQQYIETLVKPSPIKDYPEVFVMMDLISKSSVLPMPGIYDLVYTNKIFNVFRRVQSEGEVVISVSEPTNAPAPLKP